MSASRRSNPDRTSALRSAIAKLVKKTRSQTEYAEKHIFTSTAFSFKIALHFGEFCYFIAGIRAFFL